MKQFGGPRLMTALHYDYVDQMLERRVPYREAHLAHARRWMLRGKLAFVGALGDPPHGAFFAFEVDDPAEVERFAAADPYLEAGLVRAWRAEPYNLALYRPLD